MKNTLLLGFFLTTHFLSAQNCNQSSVGFIPINDLGTGTYNGWVGGLYPNGANVMPTAHKNAGMTLAAQVVARNQSGNPDPVNGKIVWLSIGMSNTTMEASAFIPLANALPTKHPKLTLIDGALGGQSAAIISSPTNTSYTTYWATVNTRLTNAGLSANQVQVIWFKEDNPAGTTPINTHSDSLYAQTKRIMHELKIRFPNVKLCYIASRIYGGYAASTLNPEPYAYRNGWTMKKIIEDQINGDATLQFTGAAANSPWLSWGVYQWADGTNPRSDGLTWNCPADYKTDGIHPSTSGSLKVANLLLNFFQNDTTACPWFLNNCSLTTGLQNLQENLECTISPNPCADLVTISLTQPNALISILDIYGQTLLKISANSKNTPVSLAGLPPQVYFLRIQTEGYLITRPLVKE